jgi:2-oxopent-4-enoate hydratase
VSVDVSIICKLADQIYAARQTRTPIAPVRLVAPEVDAKAAYTIQTLNIERRLGTGDRLVGRKIGLTSKAVQTQLGVDQPDFGVLLASMEYAFGSTIAISEMIAPRIEGEIAFRMREGITEVGLPLEVLARHVDGVAAAFEVVDSAIEGWNIKFVDTVADNASCGAFVIGLWQPYTPDRDLRTPQMRLRKNGTVVSTGSGEASLGDPLIALQWLSDTAVRVGDPLRAGEVVLAGALGPMVPLTRGRYRLEIDGFPALEVDAE